jgi:general secretion pathway protein H
MTSHIERTAARPASAASSGFTLLELLVVLAIMAFSLVLVIGYRPPWSGRFELDTFASELASQLRAARSEAIVSDQPAAVQFDLTHRRYRAGSAVPKQLPAGVLVQLLTVAGERQGVALGDIRFNPDGSSTGGRIVLAQGKLRVTVGVDWLTGRVSVTDVR